MWWATTFCRHSSISPALGERLEATSTDAALLHCSTATMPRPQLSLPLEQSSFILLISICSCRMIKGDLKLMRFYIWPDKDFVYNFVHDPGEAHNLAAAIPEAAEGVSQHCECRARHRPGLGRVEQDGEHASSEHHCSFDYTIAKTPAYCVSFQCVCDLESQPNHIAPAIQFRIRRVISFGALHVTRPKISNTEPDGIVGEQQLKKYCTRTASPLNQTLKGYFNIFAIYMTRNGCLIRVTRLGLCLAFGPSFSHSKPFLGLPFKLRHPELLGGGQISISDEPFTSSMPLPPTFPSDRRSCNLPKSASAKGRVKHPARRSRNRS